MATSAVGPRTMSWQPARPPDRPAAEAGLATPWPRARAAPLPPARAVGDRRLQAVLEAAFEGEQEQAAEPALRRELLGRPERRRAGPGRRRPGRPGFCPEDASVPRQRARSARAMASMAAAGATSSSSGRRAATTRKRPSRGRRPMRRGDRSTGRRSPPNAPRARSASGSGWARRWSAPSRHASRWASAPEGPAVSTGDNPVHHAVTGGPRPRRTSRRDRATPA